MRRRTALLLALLLCAAAATARATGDMINLYIDKEAFLACDVGAAEIRVRPEGKAKVVRQALWPWDEAGGAYSLFVEVENTSDEKIVIDEDWLIACGQDREEIARAAFALDYTCNVIHPGQRVVLHAGVYDWQAPLDDHDVTDFEAVRGLSTFARRIRQAKVLRLRLETRGNESTQVKAPARIEARAWIEDGRVFMEAVNDTDQTAHYYTVGVVVSDREGRLMDVLSTRSVDQATIAPGQTLALEKSLQPYITEAMCEGAVFEPFAYTDDRPEWDGEAGNTVP